MADYSNPCCQARSPHAAGAAPSPATPHGYAGQPLAASTPVHAYDSDYSDYGVSELMSPEAKSGMPPVSPISTPHSYASSPQYASDLSSAGPSVSALSPSNTMSEDDLIAHVAGGADVVIEEEVEEEIVPGPGGASTPGGVVKRIRRKITRIMRPKKGVKERMAALGPAGTDPSQVEKGAIWTGKHFEWDKTISMPPNVLHIQQTDPKGFELCQSYLTMYGRWPTDAELGPGPDAQEVERGSFMLRHGSRLPPHVQRWRECGDELRVSHAMEYFGKCGRWPRR